MNNIIDERILHMFFFFIIHFFFTSFYKDKITCYVTWNTASLLFIYVTVDNFKFHFFLNNWLLSKSACANDKVNIFVSKNILYATVIRVFITQHKARFSFFLIRF